MLIFAWCLRSTTGAVSQLCIMGSPHLSFGLSSLATNPTPNSRRIRIRIAQQAPRWLTDNSPTHSSYHSLLPCTLVPYSISTPGHSDLFPFPRSFSSRIFLVLSRSFRSLALARYIADVCVCVITPRSLSLHVIFSSVLYPLNPQPIPFAQSKPVHFSLSSRPVVQCHFLHFCNPSTCNHDISPFLLRSIVLFGHYTFDLRFEIYLRRSTIYSLRHLSSITSTRHSHPPSIN